MNKITIIPATDSRAILLDLICKNIWQKNINLLILLSFPLTKQLVERVEIVFDQLKEAIGKFENCVRNAYEVTSHHGDFNQCPLIVLYFLYCKPDDFADYMADRGYEYNIKEIISDCIIRYSVE